MKSFFTIASMAVSTMAVNNSTPIFGKYPGWVEGSGKAGIQVELYEDYLCSDCLAFNPVWESVLATEWLDGTVKDQITVGVTPVPLGYHDHSYQVAQLVPYFMQLCDEGKGCYSNEYKDFSFENQSDILGMTNVSKDDFTAWWST